MSLPRIRKVVASEDGPLARGSVAKASGDSVACTVHTDPEPLRSRSKNKIPKSVRYDLENALVSLCDVWFEEIKPHLVRNNIKLHVHGSTAGGDHERVPAPEPAPPSPTEPAAPGCSHLDPGAASDHHPRRSASSAGFCSTLPTASRARCARLHMPSRRRPLSPLLSVPQTPHECAQTQSHNCEEKKLERPRNRRRHRRSQAEAQPSPTRRVPRLCHTYRAQPAQPSPPSAPSQSRDHYFRFIVPRHVMKNKSTQTKPSSPSVSRGCQYRAPNTPRSPLPRGTNSRSRAPAVCSPRSPHVRSPVVHSPVIRCEISSRSNPRNLSSHNPDPNPGPRKQGSFSPSRPTLAPTSPECATAKPSLPRIDVCRLKRPERTVAEDLPLFQDDLIDIIGESNDMRLRLLCSSTNSPKREDHPSCMTLFRPDRQARPGGLKKIPPWR
ncbi:proteoglycan 4 isoform X1 [Spodoptera frugiperda]|uniref:Proteoglycan 4 isoform X1 n=1 Tax=Spodoptera frugiperda TaxID=7108 RepID=A0A9R0EMD2_SPOFR|nr:proteoglycan 4 isoform X1 [Spodoptera frugiperda]